MTTEANTQTDIETSNPCFNMVAATPTTDPFYVPNMKLLLETVERERFRGTPQNHEDWCKVVKDRVQYLVDINDYDGYKLTVNLIKHFGNGRLEDIALPEFSGVKSNSPKLELN